MIVLLFGGVLAYALSLQKADPSAQMAMRLTVALTVLISGLCLICASSRWWLAR